MSSDDLQTGLRNRLLADDGRHDRTVLAPTVDLVARLEGLALAQLPEAGRLEKTDALRIAAAFCFRHAEVAHILGAICIKCLVSHFHLSTIIAYYPNG